MVEVAAGGVVEVGAVRAAGVEVGDVLAAGLAVEVAAGVVAVGVEVVGVAAVEVAGAEVALAVGDAGAVAEAVGIGVVAGSTPSGALPCTSPLLA